MKRSVARFLICGLFFTLSLTAYILLMPSDGAIELTPKEDSQYVYSEIDGIETVGEGIYVISVPSSVDRKSTASVKFKGKPDTEYQIRVYYASGLSESKSFDPVFSNSDGEFSWSWRISPNARVGNVRVIVTGENCRVSFEIEIRQTEVILKTKNSNIIQKTSLI